MDIYDYANF